VSEVATRYRRSVSSIRQLTRQDRIPFFTLSGSRICLFRPDHLEQWEAGVPLEVIVLADRKIVRPVRVGPDGAGEGTERHSKVAP
jgi:hypothetical protein